MKGSHVVDETRDARFKATETNVSMNHRNSDVGDELCLTSVLYTILRPMLHERNTVLGFKGNVVLEDATHDVEKVIYCNTIVVMLLDVWNSLKNSHDRKACPY